MKKFHNFNWQPLFMDLIMIAYLVLIKEISKTSFYNDYNVGINTFIIFFLIPFFPFYSLYLIFYKASRFEEIKSKRSLKIFYYFIIIYFFLLMLIWGLYLPNYFEYKRIIYEGTGIIVSVLFLILIITMIVSASMILNNEVDKQLNYGELYFLYLMSFINLTLLMLFKKEKSNFHFIKKTNGLMKVVSVLLYSLSLCAFDKLYVSEVLSNIKVPSLHLIYLLISGILIIRFLSLLEIKLNHRSILQAIIYSFLYLYLH